MMSLKFVDVVDQGYSVSFCMQLKFVNQLALSTASNQDSITINNSVEFEAKSKHYSCPRNCHVARKTEIYLRSVNISPDGKEFSVEVTCEKLNMKDKNFPLIVWHHIHDTNESPLVLFMTVRVLPEPEASASNSLLPSLLRRMWDDTVFTDFDLTCKGGSESVAMHKTILASSSHTFFNLLRGSYRKKSAIEINIPGVSKYTLQQLKNFLYLGEIPTKSFKPLLCVSAEYDFDKLEQICAQKMVESLKANTVWEHLDFAFKCKSTKLVTAILYRFQDGSIKVFDVEKLIEKKTEKRLNGKVNTPLNYSIMKEAKAKFETEWTLFTSRNSSE